MQGTISTFMKKQQLKSSIREYEDTMKRKREKKISPRQGTNNAQLDGAWFG
jgi:7,8-dihydro-6-hydroxymethylpterin-pyrophosphokinase